MALRLNLIELNEIGMEIICSHMKIAIFFSIVRFVGEGYVSHQLSLEEWTQAHLYILKNCDEVLSYVE